MSTYETELGYQVRETLGGLEVSEYDEVVCMIGGKTLSDYRTDPDDDMSDIDDDSLEDDIKSTIEADDFLAYQAEYC
jgi:hypothetical protein